MGHSSSSTQVSLLDHVASGWTEIKYKLGLNKMLDEKGKCHGLKHDIRQEYDLKRGVLKLLDKGELKECRCKATK